MIRTAVLVAIVLAAVHAQAEEKPLRVYFVGNSVTDTIKYRALAKLAKSRGHDHVWGRHMIPGAPLQWIWEHPKDGFQEPPFGHYPTALANFQWDVLSLQPFDRHLDGKDGDLVMAKDFIDLALPKSPDLQVFVYARWPRQGKDDFDTAWLKKYTGGWDGTNETKDYFERLTLELRKAYPKLKIRMVPVGHVMHDLNQRMKAGQVPGYKHIKKVFADDIHLNNVGSYVVGCTYFATLYKENPKGLPGEPYKVTDSKLAQVIQEAVWKVVSTNELAGVASQDQPAKRLEIAKGLVAQMAAGQFDKAVEPFDPIMKRALPADKLKEVWDGLTKQYGPFQRANETTTEKIQQYEVAYVTCEFQRGKLDTKVVFTSEKKITGLFFVPSGKYKPPSYADSSKFEEKEIVVGKGTWRLPGTLSLPKGTGPFPGVILVHGSGPEDRDETIGPNKPFRDLAQGLASRGVAVLRYEKRTKHYPILMALSLNSITVKEETIDDAVAAVEALASHEKIDPKRIFVLGHSLGGTLIPRIGKTAPKIAGFVSLAGSTWNN